MVMRKRLRSSICRSVACAAMAGLVLTAAEPPLAIAGSAAPASKAVSASSAITDFSSARRHRHYRRGNNAAGLAFMGMTIGTIGAIAAQQQRDDYYYNNGCGYYGCGPGYYGGPYHYGRPYYYGHRHYRLY